MADARPGRRRYELQLWIDRRVGPVVCAILLGVKRLLGRRRSASAPEEVRKVLLLKMWGMGSIVLASPLLARLRSRHPDARIDFVSFGDNEAILRMLPEVDGIHTIDLTRGNLFFVWRALRTILAIRRERYDLLLDLEFFTRFSAVFSFLANPRRSHGFSAKGNWRGKLHDVEVPFNAYSHVATNFETLLHGDPMSGSVGVDTSAPDALPLLAAPEGTWEVCHEMLSRDPAWSDDRPTVVVNPNAGDMAVERRWPVEQVGELLRHLGAGSRVNAVLVGAPSEREHVESVAAASGVAPCLVDLAGRLDVPQLVALLAHASVFVTNDSGPMHLAAAAGTSTVSLFGPETPTLYAPLRSRSEQSHRVHYLRLACSPCMFVHDNKVLSCWFAQARCMTGIRPADVLASVEDLLAGDAGSAARLRVVDS